MIEALKLESTAWAMFYSGLVSIYMHPGNKQPPMSQMQLEKLANIADGMMIEWLKRYNLPGMPEEAKCRSSQQ